MCQKCVENAREQLAKDPLVVLDDHLKFYKVQFKDEAITEGSEGYDPEMGVGFEAINPTENDIIYVGPMSHMRELFANLAEFMKEHNPTEKLN